MSSGCIVFRPYSVDQSHRFDKFECRFFQYTAAACGRAALPSFSVDLFDQFDAARFGGGLLDTPHDVGILTCRRLAVVRFSKLGKPDSTRAARAEFVPPIEEFGWQSVAVTILRFKNKFTAFATPFTTFAVDPIKSFVETPTRRLLPFEAETPFAISVANRGHELVIRDVSEVWPGENFGSERDAMVAVFTSRGKRIN
jgi:hypothetical protein